MERTTLFIFIVLHFTYVCIGAAIFMLLEREKEETSSEEILNTFNQFLANHSSCLTNQELQTFIRHVLTAHDDGVLTTNETVSATLWDYSSSLFFAMTVTTTIGYGHQSPVTGGGQAFCVVFALLGIPLTGLMLVGIGERLKGIINFIQKRTCTKYKKTESAVKHIMLNLTVLALLTLVPAVIFHNVEDWTFGEAVYYCFITLTTIGFGDFVAANNPDQDYRALYKILVNFWIYIGLAWFTTLIAYITERYTEYLQKPTKYKQSLDLTDMNGK